MWKKLFIAIALLTLIQYASISQTGTNNRDTVCVPLAYSVQALQDLTRYDSLKIVTILQDGKIMDLQKVVSSKDEQLRDCQDSRNRLNLVIANYQSLQQSDKASYSGLENLYKKEVRAGRFKLVLIGGLIALTGYAFLK